MSGLSLGWSLCRGVLFLFFKMLLGCLAGLTGLLLSPLLLLPLVLPLRFDLQVSVFASRLDALDSGSPPTETTGDAGEDSGVTAPDGSGGVSSPAEEEAEERDRDLRERRRFKRSLMAIVDRGLRAEERVVRIGGGGGDLTCVLSV